MAFTMNTATAIDAIIKNKHGETLMIGAAEKYVEGDDWIRQRTLCT